MRSGGRSALLSSSVHDATAPNDSVGRKSKPWAEGNACLTTGWRATG
jgi:hypothetical protein